MGKFDIGSNVVREINVNKPQSEITSKLKYLCLDSKYYKSFDDSESVLGLYKYNFKKPISGIVNLGMQVVITLQVVDETNTKIHIEVIDNVGGNDGYDIQSANMLINEVTKSLTKILQTSDVSTLNKAPKRKMNWLVKVFIIFIAIPIVVGLIMALFS